ncbi:hypothetical protein [Actinokineospora xionganensis]|uniref:Uncharacterized protein n=1 Tax=Actinokineospora xionganensis TaxID=2684470 RepID=A0ABR7L121_9PSEU|nr:hypothetical protein [Actinokineospora xionganensis]MBC6446375.1 hypothetical protein [Actinokineospora xionganensis]
MREIDPFGSIRLAVGGQGGIPAGVTAVAMNLTVTNSTQCGYITGTAGQSWPLASTVDFVAGQTVPNMAILPVAADGRVDFYNGSPGTTGLIADVTACFVKTPSADTSRSTPPA